MFHEEPSWWTPQREEISYLEETFEEEDSLQIPQIVDQSDLMELDDKLKENVHEQISKVRQDLKEI